MGKGIIMKAIKAGYIILIILFVAVFSCSDRLSINHGSMINGTWIAEFEVDHYDPIQFPDGSSGPSKIVIHTSTMTFMNGEFIIRIDPPVPPFFNMWATDSVWEGQYTIAGDELILMAERDSEIEINEIYTFRIDDDILSLGAKFDNRINDDGNTYMIVPIWGGLPWGRAKLCHGGSFARYASE